MRAALYARVSTEDQAKEGYSLEAQLERLRSFCKARGWNIAEEYVDDGYSGRDDNRPAYRRMMEERDRWDTILVMKMDRIHRNSRNFMEMMERLRSWGKEFTSMQESLDTGTAMGRFVMDIIQRIAQLESEQIAERVYTGMKQKAKSGQGSLGFPAPFGYRYRDGQLIVHPEEAEIVREIFRRYGEGEPMAWIAEELNSRGLKTSKGSRWTVWSVRYLLQNPIYAGYLRWDDVVQRGVHEPIIEVEMYLRALRSFQSRARIARGSFEALEELLKGDLGTEAA
jgi:DNA invertase Pin-like site-specific DNA recombinase